MNPRKIRITAICLSIVMLQNIVSPTVSLALRTSPIQPEYSAYESLETTDMVNLITGDFTYNMPLLEVPSPEGGFALPLSYHAGIELNEEASWVGLGWSLNVGAITRSVSQYPDDCIGEPLSTNIQNGGGEGYAINYFVGTRTYDSEKGKGGSIGLGSLLSVGVGNKSLQSLTTLGVTFDHQYKNGIHVDPVGVAMSLLTIASMGIGGATGQFISAASWGYSGVSMANSIIDGNGVYNINNWTIEKHTTVIRHDYKYYLDVTKTENMYGSLYLGQMQNEDFISTVGYWPGVVPYVYNGTLSSYPSQDQSIKLFNYAGGHNPSSDFVMNNDNPTLAYVVSPTKIAYDNYNVKGSGISGNIQPYRHDVGSLAFPTLADPYKYRFNLVNYLSNKVNFIYDGEIANSYLNHIGTAGQLFQSDQFGVEVGLLHPEYPLGGTEPAWESITLKDQVLYNSANRTEADRLIGEGLKNNHLAGSRNIEWYSNSEIADNTATSRGFIDFMSNASNQRTSYRTTSIPAKGIGGFSVTRSDGMTYHYALPVYNSTQTSTSLIVADDKSSSSTISTPFAVTWLLTAITGSDYVDRGEVGILDNNDWGYWVKFDYGKFSDSYHWHSNYSPYDGTYSSENNSVQQNMRGNCETYYLNTIATRTHTALFIKDIRNDGKSAYQKTTILGAPIVISTPSSSLKLNEIVLLKNEDWDVLKSSTYGFTQAYVNSTSPLITNGDSYNAVIDKYDFTQPMRDYIKTKQLRKIIFNYYTPGDANELCKQAINSYAYTGQSNLLLTDGSASYSLNTGKLTLKSVSIQSTNNKSIMPDHLFEYGTNPNYDIDKWDGWGMYKSNGQHNKEGHQATTNGTEWSLIKVTSPLGGEINISYERDDYSSISGTPIASKKGGDIRVSSISVKDENGNQNISQYVYTQDGTTTGISSGVCSMEPSFIKNTDYPFYKYLDYPFTPVMYGKVSLYEKSNNTNYPLSITEYNFVTPHQDMITQTPITILEGQGPEGTNVLRRYKFYNYNIEVNTASIGNLISIKTYNNKNQQLKSVSYEYTDGTEFGNNIGKRTEGSILCERLPTSDGLNYLRLFRTTKLSKSSIQKSITIKEPGSTQTITNTQYDYLTGAVTSSETNNSFGGIYRTVSVPAYTKYPNMGSKVDDINNKNMLSQEAESYTYDGSALLSANVQTWHNNWNYRELINSGTTYSSIAYNDASYYNTSNPYTPVWRKHQSYVWKSPVNSDGTLSNFTDFVFTQPSQNAGWQKASEVTLYDHYSKPIEAMDINNNYSASKTGYDQSYVIASASNSNYAGFAYSGAEDVVTGTNYFGGEVSGVDKQFTQTPLNGYAHTGNSCIKVRYNNKSFIYTTAVDDGTSGFTKGKKYRASVWAYKRSTSNPGRLYYVLKDDALTTVGTGYVDINSSSTKQAGNFYLLSLDIDVPAATTATSIEVYSTFYLESGDPVPPGEAAYIYFDDFRVHPVDATMTSYVYDNARGLVTAILDNENFATKFYYDNAGRLIRTDKETMQGVKLVSQNRYHYGRGNN